MLIIVIYNCDAYINISIINISKYNQNYLKINNFIIIKNFV